MKEITSVDDRTSAASLGWLAAGFMSAIAVWVTGLADPDAIGHALHLEPLLILVALDRYADLVGQTNGLTVLARRAALAARGRPHRAVVVFVGLLLVVGAVDNNITTALVVLPAVLVTLRSMQAGTRLVRRMSALVLAGGNIAGASTPTGDFPALILVAAGAISYREYFVWGTPLFLATALVLVIVYRFLLTDDVEEAGADLGLVLLQASSRHLAVDARALRRLGLVFAAMIVCWILSDPHVVSPAVIAWTGLAFASIVVSGTGIQARITSVDLHVPLKLGGILLLGATLAATGVVNEAAAAMAEITHQPLFLLLGLMVVATLAAGLVDASAAAAGLLPLVLELTEVGQPLGGIRPLAVIAYAAAVCAGSSLWTTSATAGQVVESRISRAGLVDPVTGSDITFTWRSYSPLGALNCAVQFAVAATYVAAVWSWTA